MCIGWELGHYYSFDSCMEKEYSGTCVFPSNHYAIMLYMTYVSWFTRHTQKKGEEYVDALQYNIRT